LKIKIGLVKLKDGFGKPNNFITWECDKCKAIGSTCYLPDSIDIPEDDKKHCMEELNEET